MHTQRPSRDTESLLAEIYAADLLGLSSRTLQSWRSKNEGPPYVRVGRAVRYRRQDLLNWVGQNTVAPPSRIV
jgi:predicted DNA-binding transcriptional regulator AlpA